MGGVRTKGSAPLAISDKTWKLGLLIDIGSTFTKVSVIEPDGTFVDSAHAPTTILTEVSAGVEMAVGNMQHGLTEFDWVLTSSSAAGGLRMATVGLTEALSGNAGVLAALGAGAKVVAVEAGILDQESLARISASEPHLLLLTGGTDGGNSSGLMHNAKLLSDLAELPGVIVAGNDKVARQAADLLVNGGATDVRVVDNVFPKPGEIVIAPTREAVRDLFMEHITRAKGLTSFLNSVNSDCEPTPLAVSRALWGHLENSGDPIVLIDVGGATTDVHSVGGIIHRQRSVDLPTPDVLRTVEGDLGMRWGAPGIVQSLGERLSLLLAGDTDLKQQAQRRHDDPSFLPENEIDREIDVILAKGAIVLALERHAGRVVVRHNAWGDRHRVVGKDLRDCRTLIATGGVFRHSEDPVLMIKGALAVATEAFVPRNPHIVVDRDYSIYAIGLVARHDLTLAKKMLQRVIDPDLLTCETTL